MGGSASKASRKLPARPAPTWAGVRTNLEARPDVRKPTVDAQDHKSASILEDAKDPQLGSMLSQLGQVNVRRMEVGRNDQLPFSPKANVATSNSTSKMFASRQQSEEQALSYTQVQNRMSAAALSDLLDARKDAKSSKELEELSKEYAIDLPLLKAVAKHVNSPSVGERTTTRMVENGAEKVTTQALWVDPTP